MRTTSVIDSTVALNLGNLGNLGELPLDIIQYELTKHLKELAPKDKVSLYKTSTFFNKMMQDGNLWVKDFVAAGIDVKVINEFIQRCKEDNWKVNFKQLYRSYRYYFAKYTQEKQPVSELWQFSAVACLIEAFGVETVVAELRSGCSRNIAELALFTRNSLIFNRVLDIIYRCHANNPINIGYSLAYPLLNGAILSGNVTAIKKAFELINEDYISADQCKQLVINSALSGSLEAFNFALEKLLHIVNVSDVEDSYEISVDSAFMLKTVREAIRSGSVSVIERAFELFRKEGDYRDLDEIFDFDAVISKGNVASIKFVLDLYNRLSGNSNDSYVHDLCIERGIDLSGLDDDQNKLSVSPKL